MLFRSVELLTVGAALETALIRVLQGRLTPEELRRIGVVSRSGEYYCEMFERLLGELDRKSVV